MTELDLPILDILEDVRFRLQSGNALVLQAPPGAGKSTVLPLKLLREPWLMEQKILMLEPRRLAARSVAERMAALLAEPVGQTVGFRVRFERKISQKTRIEVVTEGILTRMLQQDNGLEGVGMVIFDEFHERSLQADLAFALCRESQQILREDLRILVMSATLDQHYVSNLLGGAPVLSSEGRQFPVAIHYLAQDPHLPLPQRMARAIRLAATKNGGDILAFLPGSGEILKTQGLLEADGTELLVRPLFGDLAFQDQQAAILPDPLGRRKVVLSTSIAETSLTIEGIGVVIDGGYSRVPKYDVRSGLTRLATVEVTRDSADQRAGRAGRLGPGVCYRLWSEGAHGKLVATRTPEIIEADLAPLVLELAQWGVTDPLQLAWPTPPPPGNFAQARDLLIDLEAIEVDGKISSRGREMLRLPTHPRLAHMLIESKEWGLAGVGADIAAILEERDPLPKEAGSNLSLRVEALLNVRKGERPPGDRNLWGRIEKLGAQWQRMLNVPPFQGILDPFSVGRLISAAFPERLARRVDKAQGRYRLSNGRMARMDAHDPLVHEEWIAVAHLDAGGMGEGRIFLAAPVDPKDLAWMSKETETLSWDSRNGILVAQKEVRLGNLVYKSSPLKEIPEDLRVQVLCGAVREMGIGLLGWEGEVDQWLARVRSLRIWRPEENWPDMGVEPLLDTLEGWLGPWVGMVRKKEDFPKLDFIAFLSARLPWELFAQMEDLAPAKIHVPSGSWIGLEYFSDGAPPVLAVRLQECFGMVETPTLNQGKTKVMMHLLSPGYKPVQVTQDLMSFWKNTYPEVRKELRMRYPKHYWPEDPWTAEAVRGVKRKPSP